MCAAKCNLRRHLEAAAGGAGVLQEVVVAGEQLDQSSDMLLDGVTTQPVSPKLCPSSIQYPAEVEGSAEDAEQPGPSPSHEDEWWTASRIVEYVRNAMQRVMMETDARVEYQVKTILAERLGERSGWEQAVEQELTEQKPHDQIAGTCTRTGQVSCGPTSSSARAAGAASDAQLSSRGFA